MVVNPNSQLLFILLLSLASNYAHRRVDRENVNQMPIKKTFTDYLRLWFKWFLDPLGGFFNRMGMTPNTMTMLGLIGNTVGAYFLAMGNADRRNFRFVDDSYRCIGRNNGAPARRIRRFWRVRRSGHRPLF